MPGESGESLLQLVLAQGAHTRAGMWVNSAPERQRWGRTGDPLGQGSNGSEIDDGPANKRYYVK